MPKKSKIESALAALEQQGMLLDVREHPVEQEARETKQCTGELLLKREPGTYEDIVKALAANRPVRWIKRTFGVGTQTVYAILQREKEKVGTLKERIAEWCFMGVLAGSSRFAEIIADCDDPVALALATEKMGTFGNLMRGQATSINASVIVHVDAQAAAATLTAKAQEMGLMSGEKGALGAKTLVEAEILPPADIKADDKSTQSVDNELFKQSSHVLCHTTPTVGEVKIDGEGGGKPPTPVRPL